MSTEPKPSDIPLSDFAPKLSDLTRNVLFGDVWERPELSKRDRSLITVAALVALNRSEQLRFHLGKARENGLTKEELIEAIEELIEAITHLAFYSGWPTAMNAINVAKEVFAKA
jgi:4-carboxymuconolactone decarboxylase